MHLNKGLLTYYVSTFFRIFTPPPISPCQHLSARGTNGVTNDVRFFINFHQVRLFIVAFIFIPITPSFVRVHYLDGWVVFTTLPTCAFFDSAFLFFAHLPQRGTKLVKAFVHIFRSKDGSRKWSKHSFRNFQSINHRLQWLGWQEKSLRKIGKVICMEFAATLIIAFYYL